MPTHVTDLKNHVITGTSILPVARTNGTANGVAVDMQNGNDQCTAIVAPGAITDGSHVFSVRFRSCATLRARSGIAGR
jgi:hypothetical protein